MRADLWSAERTVACQTFSRAPDTGPRASACCDPHCRLRQLRSLVRCMVLAALIALACSCRGAG